MRLHTEPERRHLTALITQFDAHGWRPFGQQDRDALLAVLLDDARPWYRVPVSTGIAIMSTIAALACAGSLLMYSRVLEGTRVSIDASTPPAFTLPATHSIHLAPHARTKYVITEIGLDGDDTPVLASWTISTDGAR